MEHADYQTRINSAKVKINEVRAWQIRQDLLLILKNCQTQYTLMDKEYVNCRRSRRMTAQYISLATQLGEWLHMLEKRITWASLL